MTSPTDITLERLRISRGSESMTLGFRVTVEVAYVPDRSDPGERRFLFGYRIRIANENAPRARLLARHWEIVDANGGRRVVDGEGVIGRQPVLAAGQSHVYESGCELGTPWGTMEGWYRMRGDDGREFDIAVARFYLVAPDAR
jgi:ApaG protein